jgi:hypothetical protein
LNHQNVILFHETLALIWDPPGSQSTANMTLICIVIVPLGYCAENLRAFHTTSALMFESTVCLIYEMRIWLLGLWNGYMHLIIWCF